MADQSIHTESTEVMAMHVALQLTLNTQVSGVKDREDVREEFAKNYKAVRDAVQDAPPARKRSEPSRSFQG